MTKAPSMFPTEIAFLQDAYHYAAFACGRSDSTFEVRDILCESKKRGLAAARIEACRKAMRALEAIERRPSLRLPRTNMEALTLGADLMDIIRDIAHCNRVDAYRGMSIAAIEAEEAQFEADRLAGKFAPKADPTDAIEVTEGEPMTLEAFEIAASMGGARISTWTEWDVEAGLLFAQRNVCHLDMWHLRKPVDMV